MPTDPSRRSRWEVQHRVMEHLRAIPDEAVVSTRLTPYRIAKDLDLPVSSVTAACHSLVNSRKIASYGRYPFVVGPLP